MTEVERITYFRALRADEEAGAIAIPIMLIAEGAAGIDLGHGALMKLSNEGEHLALARLVEDGFTGDREGAQAWMRWWRGDVQ